MAYNYLNLTEAIMKRILNYSLLILALVLTAFLWGCSSDSESSDLKEGNPNDPNYLFMSSLLSPENIGSNLIMLDLSTEMIDSIPEASSTKLARAVAGDSEFDTIVIQSYIYRNYWHVFQLEVSAGGTLEDGVDSVSFQGIDSIRFEGAGGPMQYPDSLLTTAIRIGYNFSIEAWAPEGQLDIANNGALAVTGEYDGDVVLNGTTHETFNVVAADTTVAIDFGMSTNHTFTNVLFDSLAQNDDVCPPSGRVDISSRIDLDITSTQVGNDGAYSIHGNWLANFVFNPDRTVDISYSDGTYQWQKTEYCGSDSQVIKIGHLTEAAKSLIK